MLLQYEGLIVAIIITVLIVTILAFILGIIITRWYAKKKGWDDS
jgi:uncharacterized membrane protein